VLWKITELASRKEPFPIHTFIWFRARIDSIPSAFNKGWFGGGSISAIVARPATDQELGMDRKGDALAMMERDAGIIEPMSGKECVLFKVMLVEDDHGFRRTLARLLTSRFPSIVIGEAGDGGEAMEKVEDFLPNLILMDIYLPGQSGLELTRRIKTLYPNIHIVMLTSYDFPEYREVARASGADRFLSKGSATADEIQELVEGLCAKWTPPGVESTWYRKEAGNEASRS
jgi:CheY-like chemotaxis protein